MTQSEAEALIAKVLTIYKYASGIPEDGPRRTHNSYATRDEFRSLVNNPGAAFFTMSERDSIGVAARIFRATEA